MERWRNRPWGLAVSKTRLIIYGNGSVDGNGTRRKIPPAQAKTMWVARAPRHSGTPERFQVLLTDQDWQGLQSPRRYKPKKPTTATTHQQLLRRGPG